MRIIPELPSTCNIDFLHVSLPFRRLQGGVLMLQNTGHCFRSIVKNNSEQNHEVEKDGNAIFARRELVKLIANFTTDNSVSQEALPSFFDNSLQLSVVIRAESWAPRNPR